MWIIKVSPQTQGPSIKTMVNVFVLSDMHFEEQAMEIKRLYYKYNARRVVLDANGLGIGLVDYMIKSQDSKGDHYPPFGVENDEEGYYKKFITDDTELEAMHLLKMHAPENTDAHATLQNQLNSGKLKFLIDERTAQAKLLSTKVGQAMSQEQRNAYLKPYVLTSVLKDQMMNLREDEEGINIRLKQVNSRIKKDFFSALEYGVYYLKYYEDNKDRKKRRKLSDFMFLS